MAKIKSRLNLDGTYDNLIEKDVIPKKKISHMEMILPEFKKLPLDEYERVTKFPTVPFRMIIVGSSGSGKSELIKKIYHKDREFFCQRDYFIWYGKFSPYPSNPKEFPYHAESGDQHVIVAYDDPKPEYYPLIMDVFRLGRPKGISPIIVIHSWDQLIQSSALRILKNQANIVVLCQEAATEVIERHQASFNGFLKCPTKKRKEEVINSLDGEMDYNWVINGKECTNYKIGYPNSIQKFKQERIEPIKKIMDLGQSSSSSSSSSDSEEEIVLPMSKYPCRGEKKPTKNDMKDEYERDYRRIQESMKRGYNKRGKMTPYLFQKIIRPPTVMF